MTERQPKPPKGGPIFWIGACVIAGLAGGAVLGECISRAVIP